MKKTIKMFIVLLIISVLTGKAFAAQVIKIGFVDIQQTLENCDIGKKAKNDLQDLVDKRQKEIDKLSAEIESLQNSLEEQIMLSDEKKKEKQNVINEKMENYQKIAIEAKKEISRNEANLTEPIIKKVKDIINKIGIEEGYTIILERNYSSVLYGSKSIDITEQIIKKLNEVKWVLEDGKLTDSTEQVIKKTKESKNNE